MMTESEIRHDIDRLESRLAWLTTEMAKVEGNRDHLLGKLLDVEGASSQRPVAIR